MKSGGIELAHEVEKNGFEETKTRTHVEDVDRGIYDLIDKEDHSYKSKK